MNLLKEKITAIKLKNEITDSNIITIPLEVYNKINLYMPPKKIEDNTILYIKNLIENQQENGLLSCRRIANKYEVDTGKKISKTKVDNIIRSKFNLKF
jgi:hypothetical protein